MPRGSFQLAYRSTILGMQQTDVRRVRGARERTTIVQIHGPLTLKTLSDFQEAVRRPDTTDTIIDLAEVPFIDSAGLGALLGHYVHTQKNGSKFAVAGVGARVNMLLKMTKADTVLPTFIDTQAAENSFLAADGAPAAPA
jgi:anti-sigma B factor antagonist